MAGPDFKMVRSEGETEKGVLTSGTSICAQPLLWVWVTPSGYWAGLKLGGSWSAAMSPGGGCRSLPGEIKVGFLEMIWTWSGMLLRNSKQIQRWLRSLAPTFTTGGYSGKTSGKTKGKNGLQSLSAACMSHSSMVS